MQQYDRNSPYHIPCGVKAGQGEAPPQDGQCQLADPDQKQKAMGCGKKDHGALTTGRGCHWQHRLLHRGQALPGEYAKPFPVGRKSGKNNSGLYRGESAST